MTAPTPRRRLRALVAGGVVGAVVLAAWWGARHTSGPVPVAGSDASAPRAVAPGPAIDGRYGASLRLDQTMSVGAADGSRQVLAGHLDASFVLELVRDGDAHWLASVVELAEVSWSVAGRVLPDAAARLRACVVRIGSAGGGRFSSMAFPEDGEPSCVGVMRPLLARLQWPAGGDHSIDTGFGEATVRVGPSCTGCDREATHSAESYRAFAFAPGRFSEGTRSGHARTSASFEGEALKRLVFEEALTLADPEGKATLSFRGTLERIGAAGAFVSRDTRWTTTPDTGARARAAALRGRANGVTVEKLLADLDALTAGGRLPDHAKWLWRATGLLLSDPAAAAALVHGALERGYEGHRRALVADLLASAGDPPAQAALRTLLSAPSTVSSSDLPALTQRLLAVQSPDAATLDFTHAQVAASSGATRRAYLNALGGSIGRASKSGGEVAARLPVLVEALRSAADPVDVRAALMALGNAGQPGTLDVVAPHLASGDPAIRASAAQALARLPDDAATTRLVSVLSTDGATLVQRAALDALRRRTPNAADLAALAGVLATSPPAAELAPTWFSVAQAWGRVLPPETLVPFVRALAAATDGQTGHAVRELLAALERR